MIKTTPILADVVRAQTPKGASRAHTQFHSLIRKIDGQKQLLEVWSETVPLYRSKVAAVYEPLRQAYITHRAELVRLFDRAAEQPLFKKRDREKLVHLIQTLAGELIAQHELDDLKPIYDKYSETDFDTEARSDEAKAAELMKAMLGIDFDDAEDVSSPEKLAQATMERLRRMQQEDDERRRQAEERRANRPKTARQLEKEAQQQAELQKTGKSIQEIYRKLVTAMHPDREPDPVERERKTALMQQVNSAYEKKDLLQLLELQLTLEQIDPSHLASLAEDRVKRYNKILREQSAELAREITQIENELRMQLNLAPFQKISPKNLLDLLNRDIATLKRDVANTRRDVDAFRDDQVLKAWLKEFRIPQRSPIEDLLSFDTDFTSLRF